jgi:hypothetical protein
MVRMRSEISCRTSSARAEALATSSDAPGSVSVTSSSLVFLDVGECLMDRPGCFLGRVGGLDRLLPGPERVDLRLQALTGNGQPLLLTRQGGKLTEHVGELLPDRCLAGSRLAGQILPPDIKRLLALAGEPAAHLGQGFELALVGVVEGFPRIIRWPEHGTQRDDKRRTEALARLEHR